jgi:hypothetical protein
MVFVLDQRKVSSLLVYLSDCYFVFWSFLSDMDHAAARFRVGCMSLVGFLGIEVSVIEAHSAIAFRSWRMIGRAGARRTTVLNPARAKVEA